MCWELYQFWYFDNNYIIDGISWIELGNSNFINFVFVGNAISALILIIMITGSFFVVLFVYAEMWDDKEGANFVILLMLFIAFMAILVISGNLFVFYLGWEGIGLTSLFLISFWSERTRAIKATLKVYSINKIGDFLILVSLLFIFINLGNTEFIFLNMIAPLLTNYNIQLSNFYLNVIQVIATLLVLGGGVKSAQFGFHIWLLEAMEAPLGASALMHSSTLVVAGVTLVYKLAEFISFSTSAHYILTAWGAWTALFAAFIACFQYELKIILAYSTISSMGFLYYLLGLGIYTEMLNYLVIHAYAKIFLFLVVGAIILHCNGCQDIRWMGNLMHYIPSLYISFVIGSINLAGLPYWSGYYCKNAIWEYTLKTNYFFGCINIFILLTSVCTNIYLIRTILLVFTGNKNGHKSIYCYWTTSFSLILVFAIMALIVNYNGIFWTQYFLTTTNFVHYSILNYYSTFIQILTWISKYNYILLSILYLFIYSGIYICFLTWHTYKIDILASLLKRNFILFILLLLYFFV